ncbi:MAG TPA: hypothetical protein RMH26_09575 [Polyangiaceae bacterium LLY-WYZ-15_(1-7)]|nr:hypothetical protein [Polyangiaceae bacterium LLY-WYZ-15_(1-7)]
MRRWRRLAAGASMRLRVPVGGYVLIGEGRVRVAAPAGERRVEGPGRAAVGGGAVRVTAETDATVAVGTVRTRPAVTIDGDGGYASALWELLGGNRRGGGE